MKNNAGLIATVTILLAVFGISNLPKSAPSSEGASEVKGKSKAPVTPNKNGKTTGKATTDAACAAIRDRLRPFTDQPLAKEWKLPDSCYGDSKDSAGLKAMSLPSEMNFVIATAPNPISTHLPLMFDRMVEAVQQAAQDDNYTYDSSWFPWNQTSKDYPLLGDQHAAEEVQAFQQSQPGVMVFRRAVLNPTDDSPYKGGLVVFVVAEQPTGGIDREEFENALAWIERLGALTPEAGLKILGPNFSGSLPSLDQALRSNRLRPTAVTARIDISVSSGSVSSESSYHWFENRMKDNHVVSFQTALQGDSLMTERLFRYLTCQGYSLGRVAVISEDETAFGTGSTNRERERETDDDGEPICDGKDDKKHEIYLYYPRDIATLRSAYEQQSIFNSGKQPSNGNVGSTTLRGDLSEPVSGEHDTVRSYGGQLTPLAQESVLLNITKILKEQRIQFVLLRSTNALDQIFLTQFFRRANPEARIVLDGADLLFQRGAEGSSLRGVMLLSSYPLLTRQQDWTLSLLKPKNGSYRIFANDAAEGLYIAARKLFLDPLRGTDVPINNYGTPAWALSPDDCKDDQRPATWISVIGHHQFWPVAVLNSYPLRNSQTMELLPTVSSRHNESVPEDKTEEHPLRLTVELVVLLVVCSVWSFLHFIWCKRGSITPFPSSFREAHFAPILKAQHPALIAFGSLLPAAVAVVTAATSGLLDWSLRGGPGIILAVWTLSIVLASFFACRESYKLPRVSGDPSGADGSAKWQRNAALVAGVVFVLFVLIHFRLISGLTRANSIPVYWRSAHLLSGVSPLLPQLLLLAGLYLWFWFCLRGLALFSNDRPLLPKLGSLPSLKNESGTPICVMPMFSHEEAATPVEDFAIPIGKNYVRMLGIMLVATAVVCALVLEGHTIRTLGERRFGIMMFYWLSLCIAIILADTLQLWSTWRELRPLLVYLDRLPLRRTLASLRGLSWGSVWAMSGNTMDERYRVISRQFESLRHLGNLLTTRDSNLSAASKGVVLREIDACQTKGTVFAVWYSKCYDGVKNKLESDPFTNIKLLQEFQEELAATSGSLLTNLLRPAWQRETESLIFDKSRADGKEEADKLPKPPALDSVPPYVLAAEEFVVLPYLGFIQNILGRMRTIVLGSLFLFVAATLAVSSYPFDPLPTLGGIFLTVFAITGGTVILIFAQMHRDATLSHITNTRPGELGGEFWIHLVTFGVGPLLGLLTTLFPSITDFVTSWLQPGMQALK